MNRVIWPLFLVAALTACTSTSRLEKGDTALSENESVVILGVSPPRYRVMIFPGSIKDHDGNFYKSVFKNAVFVGPPEDGFVVAKVSTGDTLALTDVTAVNDKNIATGRFEACGGIRTIVFNAPSRGGKVLYLGDVHYEMADKKLSVKYTSHLDAAKRYIKSNYPALGDRVEQWNYKIHPVGELCSQTVRIPIYVPIPKY
jgi:hypothetical protein